MRILYLSKGFTSHDRRFLWALSGTLHEIYFLPLNPLVTKVDIPNKVTQIYWPHNISSEIISDDLLSKLKRIIQKIAPDVIQAGPIQTIALLVALLEFKPLVSVSWGYDLLMDADKNNEYRLKTKKVLEGSNLLICDCIASQEKAIQFDFPAEKIVTFPWGVDLNHFKPAKDQSLRKQLGWEDKFIILCTRAWEPIYGVELVVNAFTKITETNPNVHLLLLGSGSQDKILLEILKTNHVIGKVHIAGQVDLKDLPKYYNTADLYVSASHVDGSSVSLMEAMACGLPVLVSDIPGNKEWVEPGNQGWIFAKNDEENLVKKLQMIMNIQQDLFLISENARHRAEQRADWNKNFQCLVKAYDLMLLNE